MVSQPPIDPRVRAALEGRTMILGVGAQKAGTSWMFEYLSGHPDVLTSPIKELHVFDAWLGKSRFSAFDRHYTEGAARPRRPLARLFASQADRAALERAAMAEDRGAYLRYFARRLRGERFLCEFTPGYSLLDAGAWRRARRFLEAGGLEVRPVFLMRDPVDRHLSSLRMMERQGKAGDARATFRASLARPGLVRHGRYDRSLRALWRAFGEERVAVAFYEDIFAGGEAPLRALTASLGLSWRAPDFARRVNAAPGRADLSAAETEAAVEAFRPVYAFVRNRFGAAVPASWRG